jgi:DNA-binding transcriptional LysR family regulator
MQLELVAWHEGVFEDVMRGKLDVAVSAARVPPPLKSEVLFEDNFVCVVSAGHPLAKGPMTAESYFEFPHVRITIVGTERDLVDEQLTALGKERRIGLRVPYLTAAVMAVEDTPLITTTLRRIAEPYAARAKVAILNCPFKLAPGRVLMSWHPRMDAEPAHLWFRETHRRSSPRLVKALRACIGRRHRGDRGASKQCPRAPYCTRPGTGRRQSRLARIQRPARIRQ